MQEALQNVKYRELIIREDLTYMKNDLVTAETVKKLNDVLKVQIPYQQCDYIPN